MKPPKTLGEDKPYNSEDGFEIDNDHFGLIDVIIFIILILLMLVPILVCFVR